MPAFPPGCSAAPVCRYFSEVCCFCCWPGCRYIWHIIPESVPMMHRCRRDRSWNIIISIITIVHTLFLQGMLWLGSHIFGSVNAGMAFYTAVQMLLLSGSMAYGMLVLHHRKTAAGWQLAIQLLGMFFPFHWYMSVSMTKDTVFSVFLLL